MDDFLHKYEAHVAYSPKRYARRKPVSMMDWNVRSIDSSSIYESEPCLEVTIPQHRLRELVERDRYFNELLTRNDYASKVVNQMVADEVVRKNNPAVEKAWRNYQMLLELSRK